METATGTLGIIEEVLGHIAEHSSTGRVLWFYQQEVSNLSWEEQIQLWDIMQRLFDWKRAHIGTKLFNDALAIMKWEMEMPKIQTQVELSD
jgi:hypothetical protein